MAVAHRNRQALVIAVTSRALFNLSAEDLFHQRGVRASRAYKRTREKVPLARGPAFPLVRRLLAINRQFTGDPPVEVVLLSRSAASSGGRVLSSIVAHGLQISRAVFTGGCEPVSFAQAV